MLAELLKLISVDVIRDLVLKAHPRLQRRM